MSLFSLPLLLRRDLISPLNLLIFSGSPADAESAYPCSFSGSFNESVSGKVSINKFKFPILHHKQALNISVEPFAF